jgi:GntR family transcriptional regulator/MocR family aminotransferase
MKGSAVFILNNHEPVPLYKQLYNQIRERILSGKMPADSRLPSVRDMAVELSTSRNTVEGAYHELYAEGYIFSKPRSGYFVSALDQDAVPQSLPGKRKKLDCLPGSPPGFTFDFHPARLDPASFPAALWRKCFTESLHQNTQQLVQYGDAQGDWGLRCSIQSYLERSRGVICSPNQIVISAGLQQSLDIVAHMLKKSHSVVAVENPGYHLPRSVFHNFSFTIFPVPVGSGGIDLDLLKASISTIAYVTPSHQLPLGCVMPVANRLALIEWADSGGNFIIEDDYDSELRYHGKPIPSLQGLRPTGNIIYTGTFSKLLSPALRMSYLVLPCLMLETYRHLFQDYFSLVSLLEQRTMAKFMDQGHWERHIRRMRNVYKKKHDALLRSVELHFGSRAVVIGQGAGLHVVMMLPGTRLCEAEIIERARQKGVQLFPFSDFHVTGKPETTTLLLGFGGMTVSEIELGVEVLSQISA